MGFRFRKRVKIGSNVHVNFSKSGISLNIGRPGVNITTSSKGSYVNLGVPGTGFSYRSKIRQPQRVSSKYTGYNASKLDSFSCGVIVISIIYAALFFALAIVLKTENYTPYIIIAGCIIYFFILLGIYKTKSKDENKTIAVNWTQEYNSLLDRENNTEKKVYWSFLSYHKTKNNEDLSSAISYYTNICDDVKRAFSEMKDSFDKLSGKMYFSEKLWKQKTYDSSIVYGYWDLPLFVTKEGIMEVFTYPKLNCRKSVHVLPTCLIFENDKTNISVVYYNQLKINYFPIKISSTQSVKGAYCLRKAWKFENSDGSRDRRFRNNKQFYIYQFGCLEIESNYYIFSDVDNSYQLFIQLKKLKLAIEEGEKRNSSIDDSDNLDLGLLNKKLRTISANSKLSSVMKDVLELIYNNNANQNQILDYLSTMYKDLSDIKDESIVVIESYAKLNNENKFSSNKDECNLRYLKELLQVGDSEVKTNDVKS